MAQDTSIEWTDKSWNFLRGCSRVSEGCRHCYAEKIAGRFSGKGMPYHGLATMNGEARWTGEVSFHENILLEALRWKKPCRVFVNSMSDLFHEKVKDEWLDKAFAVMALTPQHTYQILTKRPERMREWLSNRGSWPLLTMLEKLVGVGIDRTHWARTHHHIELSEIEWPLPNVWLGVSVEDQKTADERIPLLLQTPAAVRFLSVEPMLENVDFATSLGCYGSCSHEHCRPFEIDWVIVGGESGPNARPCDIAWIRSIVGQCNAASVPVFVKQIGANFIDAENGIGGCQTKTPEEYGALHRRLTDRKGGDMSEWPEDLRIREFPRA